MFFEGLQITSLCIEFTLRKIKLIFADLRITWFNYEFMNKKLLLLSFLSCLCFFSYSQNIKYPVTKKIDQKDTYFNTVVEDPYRWLEDDHSAETAAWVKEQNKVTEDYLSKIPYRAQIKSRMTQLWNFPKYSAPFKAGSFY